MDNPSAPISPAPPQPTVEPEVSTSSESSNRRWILWSAIGLTFLIFGIAIGIFSVKFFSQSTAQPQISTYQDCLAAKGNIVQESYPATCVTASGQRFVQPLTDEEKQGLQPPDLYREPTSSAATADWKTFNDDKNGIEFKYPSSWYYQRLPDWTFDVFLEDKPFGIPQATEFLSSIQIHFNEVENTVTNQKRFMEKTIGDAQTRITDLFSPQSVKIIENLTIDGKQAIQIFGITGPGPLQGDYFKYTVIQLDNKVLFAVLHGKEHEAVYDQILSTFKFLD